MTLLHASLIGPVTVIGFVGALVQPGNLQPAYGTRWRLFRACGTGRWRSALWVMSINRAKGVM